MKKKLVTVGLGLIALLTVTTSFAKSNNYAHASTTLSDEKVTKLSTGTIVRDGNAMSAYDKKGNWVYTGWNQYGGRLPSEISGVVIALLGDSTALINSKDPDHEDDQLWHINPENTPSVGTKVEIKVTFPKSKS